MRRALFLLLIALGFGFGAVAAEPGQRSDPTSAVEPAPDPIAQALAANTVLGLVALARDLAARDEPGIELDAARCAALYRGMPPRIRPYFSTADAAGAPLDLVGAGLARGEAGDWRLTLRFRDDWIADPATSRARLGTCTSKGHHATIYLSRARVVSARLPAQPLRDPRALPGGTPYGLIQHNRRIFAEQILVERLDRHPWSACSAAPIGLTDIQGLALQIDVSGWWKNATDIEPATSLFTYGEAPDAHIWLAYSELAGHVDRKHGIMQVERAVFAGGLTAAQAFPAYLGLSPDRDDHFSVIDLTEEGAAPGE